MLSIVSNPRSWCVIKSDMANKMLEVWKQGFIWHGLESKNVNTFGLWVFNCLYGNNYWWGVFSTMHVTCVVWFFVCCKFLLFLETWGCLKDEEVVMENWWNNVWMKMCDGGTKWRCKELVKDMQVKEGIFKLEIKYIQKFALVCV